MNASSAPDVYARLRRTGVVAVLDDRGNAVPLARALLAGVGTVLTPQQLRDVKSVGANFGVTPAMNPTVVR